MQTLGEILKKTTAFLDSKGVEKPRLQSELLLAAALKINRLDIYLKFEQPLTEAQLDGLRNQVRRRAAREPLQYIIGETPFRDLTLKCDPRALIPRQETEELVGLALAALPKTPVPVCVADLGTGTGAIALSVAQEHAGATVTATDASAGALALARENAARCGLAGRVSFHQGDWFAAIPEGAPPFDAVLANPPYLTEAELATAAPEVAAHEPHSALVAADEGLADLFRILEQARARLRPNGFLALETGIAHAAPLAARAAALGYARHETHRDLSGRERFFLAWA